MKFIFYNIGLGCLIFVIGGLTHDLLRMFEIGDAIAIAGIGYIIFSIALLAAPLYRLAASSRAHKEIRRLDELLQRKIITQSEFDLKAQELKAKILRPEK